MFCTSQEFRSDPLHFSMVQIDIVQPSLFLTQVFLGGELETHLTISAIRILTIDIALRSEWLQLSLGYDQDAASDGQIGSRRTPTGRTREPLPRPWRLFGGAGPVWHAEFWHVRDVQGGVLQRLPSKMDPIRYTLV